MTTIAVIPARYGSSRLPGKPLLDICGKPLIQRVWDKVVEAQCADRVIVATDDQRIAEAAASFGADVMMTSVSCNSGTDRVKEIAESVEGDIFINIQGDEPLLAPPALRCLSDAMTANNDINMATLCCPIDQMEAESPHHVKVVVDYLGNALYFSRYPIPYIRDKSVSFIHQGHIGVYAYRRDVLAILPSLPFSALEQAESLEQLRFLQAGITIRVIQVSPMEKGVDTPNDLERVRKIYCGDTQISPLSL